MAVTVALHRHQSQNLSLPPFSSKLPLFLVLLAFESRAWKVRHLDHLSFQRILFRLLMSMVDSSRHHHHRHRGRFRLDLFL